MDDTEENESKIIQQVPALKHHTTHKNMPSKITEVMEPSSRQNSANRQDQQLNFTKQKSL